MITSIVYLLIIVFLFIFLQKTGLLNYLAPAQTADSKMGYGLLFLTGIFTSVHCLAMCGGINLSQSLGGKNAVIKYNLARILSYTHNFVQVVLSKIELLYSQLSIHFLLKE